MIKVMTYMGKLENGDPHKEYWWKADPLQRLKIANEHILNIFQIKNWKNFPISKNKISVRKLSK